MGKKKGKGNQDNDDHLFTNTAKEADFTKNYVSQAQKAKFEAAEANLAQDEVSTNKKKSKKSKKLEDEQSGEDSQEEARQKQSKRNRKGGKEMADDFDVETDQSQAQQKPAKKAKKNKKQDSDREDGNSDRGDSDDQERLQKEIEENFEGIGKKNTRKKKNKMGGVGMVMDDDIANAFDQGADSDEIHERKGAKNKSQKNKQDKRKGKKGKKEESEEEDPEREAEEEKVQAEDTKKAQSEESEDEQPEYPLPVVYCQKCGVPPEYCAFVLKQDTSLCKQWLRDSHPVLFAEVYGEEAGEPTPKAEDGGAKEGELGEGEEEKKEEEETKKKKKVKFGKDPSKVGLIHVYRQKRGGRKLICQLTGFEHYTKDLKTLASKFGKKFSCGSSIAVDDMYGECISVQGDIEDRLLEYLETDKDMIKLEIPAEKIVFEDTGNKKGRKRA